MGTCVGFTGTRRGMTQAQRATVEELLAVYAPDEVHHGDCVGGDAEFHEAAVFLGIRVVVHPPDDGRLRAFCVGASVPPLGYLERNRAIVDASSFLIGCPKEEREPAPARGQGTWAAIRYARKSGVPTFVVWPDGSPQYAANRNTGH